MESDIFKLWENPIHFPKLFLIFSIDFKIIIKQVLRIQKLNDRERSTINCENTVVHTGLQDYRTT